MGRDVSTVGSMFLNKRESFSNIVSLDEIKIVNSCRFFKIERLTYEDDHPRREVFENVISSLNNKFFNFVYFLNGTKKGIEIYLGIQQNSKKAEIDGEDYAENILKPNFTGNFLGSSLKTIQDDELQSEIFDKLNVSGNFSLLSGVPSFDEDSDSNFQGMDRIVNSMFGSQFNMLIICQPESKTNIEILKNEIYSIYNELHKNSKVTHQSSKTETKTKGTNKGGSSSNTKRSTSRTVTIDDESKTTNNASSSVSTNYGMNSSEAVADGDSFSKETIDKESQLFLKYLDEELLKRLNIGNNQGLFKVSTFLGAKYKADLKKLENNAVSLFQGDATTQYSLWAKRFDNADVDVLKSNLKMLRTMHSSTKLNLLQSISHSIPQNNRFPELATYLTAKEISLMAGLPTNETCGIPLVERVEFGLNTPTINDSKNKLKLGKLVHTGTKTNINVNIDKRNLNKHLFIAGVTGSGKTTTAQSILINSKLPFMVIEPAKTEYRSLLANKKIKKNLQIFTLGDEKTSPFRINPFEFLKSETIVGHVDMLKASFEAAFDMEAAMPQILECAIFRCYEKYGWDIQDDSNIYLEDVNDAWEVGGIYFPMLQDLPEAIIEIVNEKGFDDRLKNDYIGSLNARIESLLVGSKGFMLNCRKSFDFDKLLDKNVIIELDDVKNSQDKSLIMGFILSQSTEAIKQRHSDDNDFLHITLIEEAHRLLEKVPEGVSNSKKNGVEMFTNMLAENRKYGECLIIADQIPNKLTPEVLKNTNTKIVHRIVAQDDKESLGNTIALDDKQKEFLGKLPVGETIVYSDAWNKAIRVKIDNKLDTNAKAIDESIIAESGNSLKKEHQKVFFPEIYFLEKELNDEEINEYIQINLGLYNSIKKYFISILNGKINEKRKLKFKNLVKESSIDKDILVKLIAAKLMVNSEKLTNQIDGEVKNTIDDVIVKELNLILDENSNNTKARNIVSFIKSTIQKNM